MSFEDLLKTFVKVDLSPIQSSSEDSDNEIKIDQNENNRRQLAQHSTDESSTTQNEENVQSISKKSTEPVYLLDLNTRDEIVVVLNRYSRLLCGGTTTVQTKEKLMNDNTNLYRALIDLPLKFDASDESHHSGVALDIESSIRSQIVKTLFANHSLVFGGESVSEERKSKMVEQNNELVARMAKLPIGVIDGSVDGTVSNGECKTVKLLS